MLPPYLKAIIKQINEAIDKAQRRTDDRHKRTDETNREIAAAINEIKNEFNSDQVKRDNAESGKTRRENQTVLSLFANVAVTFAILVVSVGQLCVYMRQAAIMGTQTGILDQQIKISAATQRAIVTVSGIKAVAVKDISGAIKSWNLIADIANRGNSTTKNLRYVISIEVVSSRDHDPYTLLLRESVNLWGAWIWDLNKAQFDLGVDICGATLPN
jgi:hypothetical protein